MSSVTIIITNVPKLKKAAPIYMASSVNDWNEKDKAYQLKQDKKDGFYKLIIEDCPHSLEFKFTRGSWETEETNASNETIPNRIWQESDGQLFYISSIQNWKDLPAQDTMAAPINVQLWQPDFFMPQLNRNRNVWVYLPPNYDDKKKFPVVYLQDAQNVFEATQPNSYGKWQAGAALNKLYETTGWSCIAVAIEHGNEHRLSEYSPWANAGDGGGEGKAYLQFITETLKPAVDKAFKTLTDAQNTAIMGSSMGGLISMYAALAHGNVFGKVGVFSPSFWWSDDLYELAANQPFNHVQKLVLLAGGKESNAMVPDVLAMYNTLVDNDYFEHKIMLDFYEWGQHTESFWALEFDKALRFLFEEEMKLPVTKAEQLVKLNAKKCELTVAIDFEKFELLNSYGKTILRRDRLSGKIISLKPHWKGTYIYKCYLPGGKIITKKIDL
jgi:predicted alpha/beta superfamily hydrolase